MLELIGTIGYKNPNEERVIQTKKIYTMQDEKQDLSQDIENLFDIANLENLKGVKEMQRDFKDYKRYCKENNLKADRYTSLQKYLETKGEEEKCY